MYNFSFTSPNFNSFIKTTRENQDCVFNRVFFNKQTGNASFVSSLSNELEMKNFKQE